MVPKRLYTHCTHIEAISLLSLWSLSDYSLVLLFVLDEYPVLDKMLVCCFLKYLLILKVKKKYCTIFHFIAQETTSIN